ncbi:hypothetical protein N665_0059s0010 [Sinapis alba]|nr:hypothetical protein N665_0059s0010 [Sinapis alba]
MELELPRRLYGKGLEPHVKKINNCCQMKVLELLRKKMKPQYDEVMKDPLFSHIMVIEENGLKFSARLVHSFLCKELMTSKKHEKWFIFARRPLCFSLQKYHVVIGLKVNQEKNNGMIKTCGKINLKIIKERYLEESSSWTWIDRVRLIYLCVIMGVVTGRDEKVNFPHLYMKLAMDLEKLQKYPWDMYSFDFLLNSINKTRDKLEQKEGYLMERFLFGFQIWIMEAIPAFREICGKKINDTFTGPRCGNWTGCAKLDRILDMIQHKHDWRNHVWGVVEGTSSDMDEETEIGESSHVAENADDTSTTSERNKRKNVDRGAESRKKKLLSQLAASTKGNIDTNMKKWLEGLVQAAFMTFEEKFSHQFSDRMEKFKTVVTDKLEKIETGVTQLMTALLTWKSDQQSSPSKSKIDHGLSTSKKDTAPLKENVPTKRKRLELLELGTRQ